MIRALAACCLLAALALAGCRDSANSTSTGGDTISVYSLLPLEGATATAAHDVVDGEKLALQQAGGHVGKLTVNFRSVDSSDNGRVTPASAAKAARSAAQDASAIGAIGSLGAHEARTEIPLLNEASVGLVTTASLPASLDAPELYPLGPRTFSRVTGDTAAQGRALKATRGCGGCRRVLWQGPVPTARRAPGTIRLVVPVAQAPPGTAAQFARIFRRPATVNALLGHQAMREVLDAVRAAGPHGNDRAAVARELQRARPARWRAAMMRGGRLIDAPAF